MLGKKCNVYNVFDVDRRVNHAKARNDFYYIYTVINTNSIIIAKKLNSVLRLGKSL